ncbi:hypothetical protein [Pendulispora albinea]|uniref:Uncharacterized protein n=1 Tax=Pendulispora albinea TaxID=2741071 RepID=A0ABZ2M2N8_9BACT
MDQQQGEKIEPMLEGQPPAATDAGLSVSSVLSVSFGAENYTVPSFARAFPRDEALDTLVRAFVSGNYNLVRVQAPELALHATDPAVRDAARMLHHRIKADPLLKIILVAAVMLLAVMAAWWITHDGGVS